MPIDEAAHQVGGIERRVRQKTVGKRERHGRVVSPLATLQPERTTALHVIEDRQARLAGEFQCGSYRVADGKADQGADGAITRRVPVQGRRGERHGAPGSDPSLLRIGLDCARTDGTHGCDRLVRGHAAFGEQTGGDRAGPAQAALAVDQHTAATGEKPAQSGGAYGPCGLESRVGDAVVTDWPMMPFHVTAAHLRADRRDAQGFEFLRFRQGHDSRGIPGSDPVEIRGQVALMRTAQRIELSLAGSEGDADQAAVVADGQFGDVERVAGRGLDGPGHRDLHSIDAQNYPALL